MSGGVTPSRTCAVCGESLNGRYGNAVTCGSRCRQALYRRRRRAAATVTLTAELRTLLRTEIDRRRRERINSAGGLDRIERAERELREAA